MQLPRKIDDRLKDAIVSLQFVPAVPAEAVVGYAYARLKAVVDPIVVSTSSPLNIPAGLTFDHRSVYFLSKDKRFRIDVDGQSVSFNLAQGYAGWTAYRALMEDCLTVLLDGELIRSVTRLGVRYISQFDNVRIANAISYRLDIGNLPLERRGQLRLEFTRGELHIVLTLVDGYPLNAQAPALTEAPFFSLVDLDIIHFYPPEHPAGLDGLMNQIDTAHHEQKVLFFGLLKDEFLQSLNPVY